MNRKNKFDIARDMILSSERIVCFTGAGACTDSGIPDFRGEGSDYWLKYNLKDFTFQEFVANESARENYWHMEQEFYELVKKAQPNEVHYWLTELVRMGKLSAVITQNVDGLHQKSGTLQEKVIEIHGSIFGVTCLHCLKKYSREDIYYMIKGGTKVPYCDFCHGILKSDTVLFGQSIPEGASGRALMAVLQSDLFIVVGTSLLVQPAAFLIVKAKSAKAKIIIINLMATPYDSYADLIIYGNAAYAVSRIGF